MREKYPDIVRRMREGDLVLPAVFVDGKMVSLGSVDYFTISGAIRQTRDNGTGET